MLYSYTCVQPVQRSCFLLLFGNPTPELLISVMIALTIGMTVHEFSHNYVGHLMGDPTPARQGRLTLNPLVHIHKFVSQHAGDLFPVCGFA